MTWVFSKRCKGLLESKKISVSIPNPVRERIWCAIMECEERWGFDGCESTTDYLPNKIKAELGNKGLLTYTKESRGNKREFEQAGVYGIVMRGYYPPYLFDALEIFYDDISLENACRFQRRFNEIMEESELPWRMAEGKIFPVDSSYIEEEIIRKSYQLLHQASFTGALQEFEKARTDLTSGDYEGAIQNSNLAVESTLKGILHIDSARPGELFRRVIERGLIPEYYAGFLKCFEENILRCVAIMRNEEPGAGHGQGPEINVIPPSLAELAVNLAGVIIVFLIKRHLEVTTK